MFKTIVSNFLSNKIKWKIKCEDDIFKNKIKCKPEHNITFFWKIIENISN